MKKIFVSLALLLAAGGCASRAQVFHARPVDVKDARLWRSVREALSQGPVEVIFADGDYFGQNVLTLRDIGDQRHPLTLRAESVGGVRMLDLPNDSEPLNSLFDLHDCRNVIIRGFTFTTPQKIGAALRVFDSQNIRVEHCRFIDLPGAYYCAVSVTGGTTDRVIVRDCEFKRVGLDAHAHMIYTAYDPQRVYVIDNEFEDCAGDFVRFRDGADRGVVFGCSFKSTGTFRGTNPPMITVPLFNDDNPASQPATPNYEYFGTHFIFANNSFEYSTAHGVQDTRFAHVFHHSGFDPPRRQHLLTAEQAETLRHAPPEVRKKLLEDHTGIDLEEVHIFGSTYRNVERRLVYRTHVVYGAASRGFSGVIDLSDLINASPIAKSSAEATRFFEH